MAKIVPKFQKIAEETGIPYDFVAYWYRKYYQNKYPNKPHMLMSIEECWDKWKDYWSNSFSVKTNPNGYVLARYNDEGHYTVDNCRIITNKQNIAESFVQGGFWKHTKKSVKVTQSTQNLFNSILETRKN